MAYDKPKITIDLDEYNDLQKAAKSATTDEYVLMAKEVVAAVLTHQQHPQRAQQQLRDKGINFILRMDYTKGGIYPENILIERISKTNPTINHL